MTSIPFPSIQELELLLKESNVDEILKKTEKSIEEPDCPANIFFFRAKALQMLSSLEEALRFVEYGLPRTPQSNWGQFLQYELLVAMGRDDEALSRLRTYIDSGVPDIELAKAVYVDRAVINDYFDLASEVNETRDVIVKDKALPKYALAVQCFNKSDTLEKVFSSLIECIGTEAFALVILQDSPRNSKKPEVYESAAESVQRAIGNWLPKLISAFESVEVLQNPTNKGTAPSCRRLLDRVVDRYEGFLFIEDDCLLAPDALEWAKYCLKYKISPTSYWFASCESIYFNSRNVIPSGDQIELLTKYARLPDVRSAYIGVDFVPSTCFITTCEIWKVIANIRSFTRGPDSLNIFLKKAGFKSLLPIVPRASDIGMLHELGYSVAMLGKDNVKEIKQTYILSDCIEITPDEFDLFIGDQGGLFSASVKLDNIAIRRLLDA